MQLGQEVEQFLAGRTFEGDVKSPRNHSHLMWAPTGSKASVSMARTDELRSCTLGACLFATMLVVDIRREST